MRWHHWFYNLGSLRFQPAGILAIIVVNLCLIIIAPLIGMRYMESLVFIGRGLTGLNELGSEWNAKMLVVSILSLVLFATLLATVYGWMVSENASLCNGLVFGCALAFISVALLLRFNLSSLRGVPAWVLAFASIIFGLVLGWLTQKPRQVSA